MNRLVTALLLVASLGLLPSSTPHVGDASGVATSFRDVPGSSPSATAIRSLAADGYVKGRSPDLFEPNASVTEAEMAVLIMRAAHGPSYRPPASSGQWWEGWVDAAEREGLMKGISNPDSPATRAEMATLMWLSMGSQP